MLKKGKQKTAPEGHQEQIFIEESGESFSDTQLKEALKAACNLASSKGTSVTVVLGQGDYILKGQNVFSEKVIIKSEKDANVILDNACVLQIKSNQLQIIGVRFSISKRTKKTAVISLNVEAELLLEKCSFEPNDGGMKSVLGIQSRGLLNVSECTFRKFKIDSYGEANFSVCKFFGEKQEGFGVTANSASSTLSVKDSSFENVKSGIIADNGAITVISTMFNTTGNAIHLKSAIGLIDRCKFSSEEQAGVYVIGKKKATIKNSSFNNSAKGIVVGKEASCKISSCEVNECSKVGLEVNRGAANIENMKFVGGLDEARAIIATMTGSVHCVDVTIEGFANAIDVDGASFTFNGLRVTDSTTALKGSESSINGSALNVSKVTTGVHIEGGKSVTQLSDVNINDARIGLFFESTKNVKLQDSKLTSIAEVGVKCEDTVCEIQKCHVNNAKSKGNGFKLIYKKPLRERSRLDECKAQSCKRGIEIIQQAQEEDPSVDAYGMPVETFTVNQANGEEKIGLQLAKTDLDNCSFIKCDISFFVDGARVNIRGCSFIMSKKHSIYIRNEKLTKGNQLRKKSNLKIRWANFVEPHIDNSNSVSNEPQLMASVTEEKSFFGSAEFEPVMYLPTLIERLRQAMHIKTSQETESVRALVIMRSVHHMLILLKKLSDKMLKGDLLEDPELGMFAATFQLFDKSRTKKSRKTLIPMENLFESWKELARTRLFDKAIVALNLAFGKKQVSEDLYDEYVAQLEELQRDIFVKSKYNRRRDYLLQTAKRDPLSAWYFLDKEDADKVEGKRLRGEVLRYLAKDEEVQQGSVANFHASWVSQWAVNLLGEEFSSSPIPGERALRRAWCDKLLDDASPRRILEEYRRVENTPNFMSDVDQLLRFEALQAFEAQNGSLKPEDLQMLTSLFSGKGYSEAVRFASKLYKGQGALPGFLRRSAERAKTPESLLELLSHLFEDNNQESATSKKETVLSVMSHFFNPDSQKEPIIEKKSNKYETCQACLVQKLLPWNVMRLAACEYNHRFAKSCFKNSMSSANHGMRGVCCGVDQNNNPCTAVATRREMEMVGMDKDIINSILEDRISSKLKDLKGWKPCDRPGCIGGRSFVKKDYYSCLLCKKMVTKDGGKSDPTVAKRLLQGLDGSPIARGEGIFRECYHCAVIYEKGNACSTITCQHCGKQFSMTWGPEHISHRFDEEGVGPQMYVPKKPGKLWELGVFKTKKGKPLEMGQVLNEKQAIEVVRRAKVMLKKLEG